MRLNVFAVEPAGRPDSGIGCLAIPGQLLSLILFVILLGSGPVRATPIIPTGYVSTPAEGIAQGGLYNYFDDTGNQLADGIYGADYWAADLGNGPAYEWVGWRVADPVITFQFPGPVTINQVGIDFNRNEPIGDYIFLPSTVNIDGTDIAVDPNAIPDATRGTIGFNGSWTGSTLTITLTDNDPTRWIFVDEITFNGVPVPEPAPWELLSVGIGALIFARRKTAKAG